MKKLSILVLIAFAVSCGDAEMFVEPEGSDYEVGSVIHEKPSDDKVFLVVEQDPTFPGGMKAYSKFLGENLNYPQEAKQKGIEGNVYITFVVGTDGSLSDFELLRNPGGGLGEEALRVYMDGPNWVPGMQKNQVVKTRMTARVAFRLDDENMRSITMEEPKEEEVLIFETEVNN
ncbi:energy transducer TonB [Roseivirga sp. E12]|uniref:energy transducer TonB n=1 Tax=Roseivirga sp. E12 TaxID=2819237 RepID=UPI001ABC6DBC|nr:energy transducer TonB [Roseivirga sp. E12]MBO3700608.1 energy transducer TonB [Roseivirga sp. E12]